MSKSKQPEPDIKEGIEYWNTQPASLDGVLGEDLLSHIVTHN